MKLIGLHLQTLSHKFNEWNGPIFYYHQQTTYANLDEEPVK